MASHQTVEFVTDEMMRDMIIGLDNSDFDCIKISHFIDGKLKCYVHVKIKRTILGDFIQLADLRDAFKWLFGVVNLGIQNCDGITKLIDGRNGNILGAIVTKD